MKAASSTPPGSRSSSAATSTRPARPAIRPSTAAAALGYNTVVQFLADHGAQLNAKNKRGQTALAAIAGRRGEGATAADRASQVPRQSTVDLLRKLGAID